MSKLLLGRIMMLVAILAGLGSLLVFSQEPAAAAPPVGLQDGGPGQEQVLEAMAAAADWLVTVHQNADGGYSSFSAGADQAPSDVAGTLDALWGLSAAGADVSGPIAFLEANAVALADYVAQDGSTAGKALLALAPTGRSLGDFGGLDTGLAVSQHLSPTGQFGVNTAFNQSLAILGMAVTGQEPPQEAVDWLAGLQATEGDLTGSWDDGFGTAGNPDSTALSLAALVAGGRPVDDPAVEAGLAFLEQAQLASGGWEYGPGFGENANSTALVILALSLLGQDLDSTDSRWVQDGLDPVSALLAWQGESGAFQADFGDGRFDDFFSTAQSLAALGIRAIRMDRGPIQAPEVSAPLEMTPTSPPEAASPAETPEPPTPTAEPTEAPAAATTEPPAAESNAQAEEAAQATATPIVPDLVLEEDDGRSIVPWIAGAGAAVILIGLAWYVLARRRGV